MSEGNRNKKRKWKYKQQYISEAKKARTGGEKMKIGGQLAAGMSGFIVTCFDDKERQCLGEAYDLLNEQMTEEAASASTEFNNGNGEEESEEDLETSLEKECRSLRQNTAAKMFVQARTGVKNWLFIQFCKEPGQEGWQDPVKIVRKLFDSARTSGNPICRHVQRILPVQRTCRAFPDDIRKCCEGLLKVELSGKVDEMFGYCVQFKARNNAEVSRDVIINIIPDIVKCLCPLSRVNLNNPDYTILVEVGKGICCLAVVQDYNELRKFNLQEVAVSGVKCSN